MAPAECIVGRFPGARGVTVYAYLGMALSAAGLIAGGEDGLALIAEGVAVLETSPSRFALAQALLELGAAKRRAGKRSRAKETLLRALELADGFGALSLVGRARAELASLGLRPRRAARHGPGSLTPSERRVAELAARGLSTPQIAHELNVTRKTVESHLSQTYRKLAVSGRGGLGVALGELSPAPSPPA